MEKDSKKFVDLVGNDESYICNHPKPSGDF